ncbi:phosphatidylethanolamine-binding protein [Crassisporium funariophilum]|nr:phosphatidylethanolamine-binding protein [Crassisporium funariophilum]
MLSAILSVALVLHSTCAQGTTSGSSLTNVTNAFSTSQIVPDVVNTFTPDALVNISFTDAVTMENVNVIPGMLLSMEQTAMEPDFFLVSSSSSSGSSANGTLVLALVDPDAPTPQNPTAGQFLHFLGGDFSADPTSGLLTNSSAALMDFFSPSPPAGSDPHRRFFRYVLLVFNQPDAFDTDAPSFVNATTQRNNFNISMFAQDVNLGNAVAGNYFLVGPASNSSASSSQPPLATLTSPSTTPTISPPITGGSPTPSTTSGALSRGTMLNSSQIMLVLAAVVALSVSNLY